jgi:hypothetical protein
VSGNGHICGYRLNVHWLSRYRAADLSRRIGNAGGSPEIADWDDVTALAASGQRQLSAVTRPVKGEDLSRVKICDLFRRSAGQLLLPDIGDAGLHLEEIGFALKTTRSIGGNKAGEAGPNVCGLYRRWWLRPRQRNSQFLGSDCSVEQAVLVLRWNRSIFSRYVDQQVFR